METVSVEVPASLVAPLRETVFLLYRASVAALRLALRAHRERPGSLDEIHEHRTRLAQVDAVLAQLGWSPPPDERAIELSAPEELLRDALRGALIDARERLAIIRAAQRTCEPSAAEMGVAAGQVVALILLLREVDGGDRS